MSASWNLVHIEGREYELMNGTGTRIKLSKSSKVDPVKLMDEMESLGVPAAYTRDIDLVLFTMLKGDCGDYLNGRVRISSNAETREIIAKVFVHEIAHHVDDMYDVTEDEKITKEKKMKAKYIDDPYAKKNVGEYFAVGFEVFYCGTKKEKAKMRKKNPVLYRKIAFLHKAMKDE